MNNRLSTTEFGKLAGVSNDTVIRKINNGEIKAIRVGNRYKIPESEVLKIRKEILDVISAKEKIEHAFNKADINVNAEQLDKFINILIDDIL